MMAEVFLVSKLGIEYVGKSEERSLEAMFWEQTKGKPQIWKK